MSSELSTEELALKGLVSESEELLDNLEQDLSEVSRELEILVDKSHQYELLSNVCRSLEELDGLGAADLFWSDSAQSDEPHICIDAALSRIEKYNAEVQEVEGRRDEILAQIDDQNFNLDALHYDLRDAMEKEESKRAEWIVEREEDELPGRVQIMPWARGVEEDERFRRSVLASFAVSLLVVWIVSVVDLPILEREVLNEVPERVARLVRKERQPPPPPPEPVAPQPEEIPEPDKLVEEIPPEDLPKATTDAPKVAETPQPDTREQVKSKGILAFRESFASAAALRPSAKLGDAANLNAAGEQAVGRTSRNMVTTSAPGSSGGINLASISRDVGGGGGGGIEGVEVGQVASAIGGLEGPDRPLSGGALAGRTDEEIQIVFDRYKAALYRLYNRELRKDPTLRGQLVLRLTIEPDGSVSFCQLQSSDMQAPMLADQVITRVSGFDFGAKEDISAVTIIYPIDFLPAA